MKPKTVYVAGFLFDEDKEIVALIRKEKPLWQKGKLNGIGGKVEAGETIAQAMSREFKEETGCILDIDWDNFATIYGDGWVVYFYKATAPFQVLRSLQSPTEEKVEICCLVDSHEYTVINNLRWLIPMALDNVDAEVTDWGGAESK